MKFYDESIIQFNMEYPHEHIQNVNNSCHNPCAYYMLHITGCRRIMINIKVAYHAFTGKASPLSWSKGKVSKKYS